MNDIRIGIIGAGGIVRNRHMPGLAEIDGAKVTAVCNRSKESGETFAREYGVADVYTDWREIVDSPDIDAVLIGAYPTMHCPVTLAALEAGKHVFCQARMAMNAREAKKMRDAALEHPELVTMICPAPTGIAGDWMMRKLLADGYVGEQYAIHVTAMNDSWADPSKEFHWRIDPRQSGLNTLSIGLLVEWVHRWFGSTARIDALIKTAISKRRDPADGTMREIEYPDIVMIHGEMTSGAVARYEFSGVHQGAPEQTIEVYGRDGMLRYYPENGAIVGARNGVDLSPIAVPDDMVRRWQVEAEWIAAIRGEDPDAFPHGRGNPTFEDGLQYMDVSEGIYHSVEAGATVDLPLSDDLRDSTPSIGRFGVG
jgi:predicted dehydrogenase